MIDYEEYINTVQMNSGCGVDPMLVSAIREAAIIFFRESEIWATDLDPITERVGKQSYDIVVPQEARMKAMRYLLREGKRLDAIGRATLEATMGREGVPTKYYRDGLTLVLNYAPRDPAVLKPHVVLVPTADSSGIDDEGRAYEGWDAIVSKACEILCCMPKQPWTDPATGSIFRNQYLSALVEARREASKFLDGVLDQMDYGGNGTDYSVATRVSSAGRRTW